jgi:HEAT repeat protein
MGATGIRALITALRDEDPHVRWNAARASGDTKNSLSIDPLIVSLRDKDSNVRWMAERTFRVGPNAVNLTETGCLCYFSGFQIC